MEERSEGLGERRKAGLRTELNEHEEPEPSTEPPKGGGGGHMSFGRLQTFLCYIYARGLQPAH